jgi:hypothetical protein
VAGAVDTSRRHGGTIIVIAGWDHSAHVLLSWNTHHTQLSHPASAGLGALAVARALSDLHVSPAGSSEEEEDGEGPLAVLRDAWALGVASGSVFCGTLGTEALRVPVTLGATVTMVSMLTKLAHHIRVRVLCDAGVHARVRSTVYGRVVDVVRDAAGEEMVYELTDDRVEADDTAYVEGFSHLRLGDYGAAQERFRDYIHRHHRDRQAPRLLHIAEKHSDIGGQAEGGRGEPTAYARTLQFEWFEVPGGEGPEGGWGGYRRLRNNLSEIQQFREGPKRLYV